MSEYVTLREHLLALREADDRRYKEVNEEREKAVRIKDEADAKALQLARDIQTYKDLQANELREQIASERGLYVTTDKLDAVMREIKTAMEPLKEAQSLRQGSERGQRTLLAVSSGVVGIIIGLVGVFTFFAPDPVTVAPEASQVNIEN